MFPIEKSIFQTCHFRTDGPSKMLVFYFSIFDFDEFLTAFVENIMQKPPVFITEIKSSCKVLLFDKEMRSRNF